MKNIQQYVSVKCSLLRTVVFKTLKSVRGYGFARVSNGCYSQKFVQPSVDCNFQQSRFSSQIQEEGRSFRVLTHHSTVCENKLSRVTEGLRVFHVAIQILRNLASSGDCTQEVGVPPLPAVREILDPPLYCYEANLMRLN